MMVSCVLPHLFRANAQILYNKDHIDVPSYYTGTRLHRRSVRP